MARAAAADLRGRGRGGMKLLFSEHKADYGHYIFPYAIWGVPEADETPADFFHHGFLPSSRDMDRFYLCRHVRVNLRKHRVSSENRRILRKGGGITATLVSRARSSISAPNGASFTKPTRTSNSARTR